MGSVGNPNPWAPYENYRDCSQGICSIYCPQFCYLIFPPPPPSDDDSGAPFSPLIIAIIGVLASAFLLVSYYTLVTRYCRRRRGGGGGGSESRGGGGDDSSPEQWQVAQDGLDESLIKTITVCKYKKGEGLIEGTDCAVCLSEFEDDESLRLLPKCSHAFHLPCIDTWLKSQSNCPLCRASVVVVVHHPSPPPIPTNLHQSSPPPPATANSYQFERRDDELVLVVDDQSSHSQEMVVIETEAGDDANPQIGEDQYRRSVSLDTFPQQLLISDILKFEDIDEQGHNWRGVGSSKGFQRSPASMKRSISAGGFVFRINEAAAKF